MVKIMLVDDEAGFATTLGERLELRSFEVCLAQTGIQAIAMMDVEKPDVVLMDLSLPDLDGLSVMDKLKGIDPDAVVMILSGHGMEHRAEALEKGAFSYIMKPVKILDLVDIITCAAQHRAELKGE